MERNPRVTGIFEKWEIEATKLSKETLDKIAELWITKILGCDERTLELFREDATNDKVGLKHAGVVDYEADSRGFWEEMAKITPELAPQEELEYLIENDDNGSAAWQMICTLDEKNLMDSLITKLVGNTLLYK